ncbi:hypothetical protein INS49_004487 [Diaporthe citri]|uniref:uncharacterized protein n=1 Tax=Diaporthe citri TaxID=83186 RepID=UPI001C7E95D5|nr:uncharacterized protein INS49_004487 [Diaporthe citri]KAG6354470.1 hypothetical protein INS49_004487 [Diaporthe citri]
MGPHETLSTKINKEVNVSRFPRDSNLRFAPRRVLDLITKDSIIQHLHGNPLEKYLIDYILNDVKELFAICVAISMPTATLIDLIQSLRIAGFTDKRVAWIGQDIAAIFPGRADVWTYMLECHRYMFQAPEISQHLRYNRRILPVGMPLPIKLCDNKPLTGGFGAVYKVAIHETFLINIGPINEKTRTAAIKEFFQGKDPKVWERETTALEKIGRRNILHVVEVKAMFIQAFRFFLVFPWADEGNLMDFWEKHKSYDRRYHIARYFIPGILRQLLGLSLALESLHDFKRNKRASYRHGDLKPENILIFSSPGNSNDFPGTWKMSDLGLAKMHEYLTGERYGMQATSMRSFGTTSYKPPEAFNVSCDTPAVIRGLRIGLPQLPMAGTAAHFDIMRHWLLECDQNHTDCRSFNAPEKTLPTRLIDVGSEDSAFVKLYETQRNDKYDYIALSHPWGPESARNFCTFRGTLEQHKEGIEFNHLPITFQDAGPDGDFNNEAKRMEDVFSQAYCVLAASSAKGQHDGFLKPREQRRYLTFREHPLPPIYVCEFMDNFQQHVLDSHLNKRGWVLQERVLARRTIYFTEKQTYWECGDGVRCETMTKMHNQLASFLGDPNFPTVAMKANQGGKIRLCQDLYARYSRLGFSHYEDRPVAIAGLEKRLISSLGLRGGFGMLDDNGPGLLRRSLLWRRAQDVESLDLITFNSTSDTSSKAAPPPTWSWMAYKGAIEYLDLPFYQVEWETKDIISPWATNALGTWSYSGDISAEPRGLRVIARSFDAEVAAIDDTSDLIIDTPSSTPFPGSALKCVILGRLRSESEEAAGGRRHFVMLVKPTGSEAKGSYIYLRAGVGFMPGSLIHFDGTGAVGLVL